MRNWLYLSTWFNFLSTRNIASQLFNNEANKKLEILPNWQQLFQLFLTELLLNYLLYHSWFFPNVFFDFRELLFDWFECNSYLGRLLLYNFYNLDLFLIILIISFQSKILILSGTPYFINFLDFLKDSIDKHRMNSIFEIIHGWNWVSVGPPMLFRLTFEQTKQSCQVLLSDLISLLRLYSLPFNIFLQLNYRIKKNVSPIFHTFFLKLNQKFISLFLANHSFYYLFNCLLILSSLNIFLTLNAFLRSSRFLFHWSIGFRLRYIDSLVNILTMLSQVMNFQWHCSIILL